MKTKRFYIIGAVLLVATGTFIYQNHGNAKYSDLALDNIEAIANNETPSNTGPGELYDCPGWFTGDGKYCRCENEYPCTETPCK